MQQISLAQTEEFSNTGNYFTQETDSCTPSATSTDEIETILFGGGDQIGEDIGYLMCIASKGTSNYDIIACLLYTSPSPRDGLLSRMPSSA